MVSRFGRGVIRLWALGLSIAMLGPVQVEAQTVPPCLTTAGEEGLVFEGTYAVISAPVPFAEARTEAAGLKLLSAVREGLGVLASVGKASAESAVVDFLNDGVVVHQCAVKVVVFAPDIDDLSLLQAGDCDLVVDAGASQLVVGHAQVWGIMSQPPVESDVFTPPTYEADIGNRSVAEMSPLSDRRIYLLGKSPGVTVLLWRAGGTDAAQAVNLCPITVVSEKDGFGLEGPSDSELCQDENGVPMRLALGQTVRMEFRDAGGNPTKFDEAAVANPAVAGFRFEFGAKAAAVTGVSPGSTSLTLLTGNAKIVANCEITVR